MKRIISERKFIKMKILFFIILCFILFPSPKQSAKQAENLISIKNWRTEINQALQTSNKTGFQFNSINDLIKKIHSFENDNALNVFLEKNDMISRNPNQMSSLQTGRDSLIFKAGKIKVDTFRKNLFGNNKKETVLQLRSKGVYSINVFFKTEKGIKKTPGFLSHVYGNDRYRNQDFLFYFESIAKPKQFTIITKRSHGFRRALLEKIKVWDVTRDGFKDVISFYTKNSQTFASSNTRNTTKNYEFKGGYPKKLHINSKTKAKEGLGRNPNAEIIPAKVIKKHSDKTIFFRISNNSLEILREEEHIEKVTKYNETR